MDMLETSLNNLKTSLNNFTIKIVEFIYKNINISFVKENVTINANSSKQYDLETIITSKSFLLEDFDVLACKLSIKVFVDDVNSLYNQKYIDGNQYAKLIYEQDGTWNVGNYKGVSYSLDLSLNTIEVTNNTDQDLSLFVSIEIPKKTQ